MIWACICFLFTISFLVRILVWLVHQDEIQTALHVLTSLYIEDAKLLTNSGLLVFLAGSTPENADIIAHPPGYPIYLAIVSFLVSDSDSVRIVQILCLSVAPVIVFLVGLKLFSPAIGAVAGLLAAISPQISYNAAFLLPDSLSALPVVLSLLFLLRTIKNMRGFDALLAGVLVGVSCWFRPNVLLLPLFFSAFIFFVVPRPMRLRLSLPVLLGAAFLVAPLTIRNYVVFNAVAPVSIGAGWNILAGIADYNHSGKFGLCRTDLGQAEREAIAHGRPDYKASLYNPDGVMRDAARMEKALEIIRSEPVWFAGIVLQRALMILRLERVPPIATGKSESGGQTRAERLACFLRPFQLPFVSAVMLPLFALGVLLIGRNREHRTTLVILLLIPFYFVAVHSFVHTEYRYLIGVQHIVPIVVAYALVSSVGGFLRWVGRFRDQADGES